MGRTRTVAVVGGGAAGLMAAVLAAERGCVVTVYEATDRVGRPILASGNGRCNFSNSQLDPREYHNAAFVESALCALDKAFAGCGDDVITDEDARITAGVAAFASGLEESVASDEGNPYTRPVHEFFARHGLVWAEEGQGRLYPASRKATSVLDVLRFSARAAGVEFRCSTPIAAIEPPRAAGKPYTLRTGDGAFERADAVIVAVGGEVVGSMLPEGAPFEPLRPMLGPLATNTDIVRMLDNTRARVDITLCDAEGIEKARESGEVLFRKYGVSGIAVFNLSRFAEPGDTLAISFMPEELDDGHRVCSSRNRHQFDAAASLESANAFLRSRFDVLSKTYPAMTAEDLLRGLYPSVLADALCKQADLICDHPLDEDDLPALAHAMCALPLTVKGIGDARQCQVHRGGVPVDAVDAATMQLKGFPGLFVVGEALDVDGPCGGYNLHWAWSTGMLAALRCSRD